jgi:hypothetical protein
LDCRGGSFFHEGDGSDVGAELGTIVELALGIRARVFVEKPAVKEQGVLRSIATIKNLILLNYRRGPRTAATIDNAPFNKPVDSV